MLVVLSHWILVDCPLRSVFQALNLQSMGVVFLIEKLKLEQHFVLPDQAQDCMFLKLQPSLTETNSVPSKKWLRMCKAGS